MKGEGGGRRGAAGVQVDQHAQGGNFRPAH